MEFNPPQTPSRSPVASDICRICHCEGDADAPLISPCYCAGSLHYVHQSCLQQWIKNSNIKNCELCKFQFVMQTKMKPFYEWEKLHMSRMERHKLFCSVVFHLIALVCVLWSLFVLIDRTADEIYFSNFEWPFWTKLVVVAVGLVGGLLFMYLQCKMYVHLCRRWHNFNRVIFVQSLPGHERQQTQQTQQTNPNPNQNTNQNANQNPNSALNPLLPNQRIVDNKSRHQKTHVKSEALECV